MESAGSTDTPDVSNPFEDISNPSSSLPETGGDTMDVDESDLPPKGETENTNTNITQDDILPTDSENMVLDENPKNTGDEITEEGDGTTKETGTDEDVQDETEEKIDDESADKRSADETAMIEDEENNEKETAEIEDVRESCETNPLEEDKMDVDDQERGTEIAEVSMEELSSEATALEEGADPMPEGEEATRNVETGTDENDVETEPDVAGPDVETITTDISEEKESGSKGKRPEESNASDKYVITHHNSSDDEKCCICLQKCAAKYVANNNKETFYICLNECLSKFKEKHQNNYVEKILRLRAFAIQENLEPEKPEEEFECENDDDKSNSDRKCMHCNVAIIPGMHLSWEAKDFCNEGCLLNYQRTMNSNCGKCSTPIADNVIGKYCVRFGSLITQFCSTACIIAYKKGNSFFCAFCQHEMRARTEFKNFCSKRCMEVCQSQHSGKERGECAVCHNIKQVEIKIKMGDKIENICGEMCCVAYKFVNKIQPIKCNACITQFDPAAGGELVIYLNNKPHTVCSEECQKILLLINRKIISCKMCMIKKYDFDMVKVYDGQPNIKFTCSNACMKVYLDQKFQEFEKNAEVNIKQLESCVKDTDLKYNNQLLSDYLKNSGSDLKTPIHKIVLTVPRPVVKQRNVATMCRPFTLNKETNHKPETNSVEIQTDVAVNKLFIPVPMPIHVPTPVHLFAQNVPFLVPIPLPLPVPIFIPTGRKSLSGIAKEIQKIRNRVPADPLEAEILMMAEKAAGDKKDESSSESETDEAYKAEPTTSKPTTSEQPSNEDVLSLALKMTDNFQETEEAEPSSSEADPTSRIESIMEAKRKNIRQATKTKTRQVELPPETLDLANPDSSLSLKYTFGVNAWKQWVTIKNAELQKTQKRPTLFKTDILQLSADDLNLSLCLFVKEVRKPSGAEYAPDTIYYLCLGIQQYLYENGRIDNIFCDPFYETFTDTFNEVCVKFSNLYNETQYIVTRVEEEHLWESKQLGAHSPLVLLNTLMFFNTKHFSLTNVSEHLQLSFSHIMKHWKRNVNAPGCRSVLLRFYPPISADGKKKKVYEQLENDANPLRCPVKLYEFYLSKCPESVKTRNDVFYLLPERSCVPDSPVWYSTMALDREPLEKMLNRIKMVKEINVALLTA